MKSPTPATQASRTGFGMILADFYLDPRAETTKKAQPSTKTIAIADLNEIGPEPWNPTLL